MRPLCFVLMPFGEKPDGKGGTIQFDSVYQQIIQPAIMAAELEPIRADEEKVGGIIHKPMFERLVLCDYAIADLTTANANVFYELGIRHGVRPHSTISIFANETRLPFDVRPLRGMPYQLDSSGRPAQAAEDSDQLKRRLLEAKQASSTDSPLFQLLNGMNPPDVSHLKTDVFRERVDYALEIKEQLRKARTSGDGAVDAILDVRNSLGAIDELESGVVVDLLLSFRAVKAWPEMISLVQQMSEPVKNTVLIREQFAFALNRVGQGVEAEHVLQQLVEERGPSSETFGLLGRVYKDRWDKERMSDEASENGVSATTKGYLNQAIDAYVTGFNADTRDAYPGINAVTLMEMLDIPDPRQAELLPVVRYAVKQRIADIKPDYWDFATMLELEVLDKNEPSANQWLIKALPLIREPWEPETTARNLKLIRIANQSRSLNTGWIEAIENELMKKA